MFVKELIEEARAALQGIRDLYRFGSEIRTARVERISGKWSNQGGDPAGTDHTHLVEITLYAEGTSVQGTIACYKLADLDTRLGETLLHGRRRGYRMDLDVFKFRYGKRREFGQLTLRLRENSLDLEGTNAIADFLPSKATLWRIPADSAAFNSRARALSS